MFGYCFVQVVINNVLNEQKGIAPIIVNGSIAIFLLIVGHAVGVEGFKQSISTPASGSSSNYTVLAGAGCFAIIIFVIVAVAGYIVSTKIGQKKQEPPVQR